jgi:Holliday junction DNA helicase RuvB
LEYYNADVLNTIVKRSAKILNIDIDDEASQEISRRSRGTPRIVNALLRRVRDFAQVKGSGYVDLSITKYALKELNIDEGGLDDMDNKILLVIIESSKWTVFKYYLLRYREDPVQLKMFMNPFYKGSFLKRTPRGREATLRYHIWERAIMK